MRHWTMLKKQIKLLIGLGTTLIIATSCTNTTSGKTIDTSCLVFSHLYFSKKDTENTIDGILDHNARYDAVCEN